MNDSQDLIERVQAGDRDALEVLFHRHYDGLRAYVRVQGGPLLRAREESTDVVQSVCRELLGKLDHFVHPSEEGFRRWLYTTALRKIRDRYDYYLAAKRDVRREAPPRQDRNASHSDPLQSYPTLATPSQAASAREEMRRVESAFDRLPDHYREVLVMARLLGLGGAEIAERTGRSEVAVRTLIFRASAKLAGLLDSENA